eukprot:m.52211 g.52211  ORF g.52211 m.52211 type:complete len:199 (-) comp7609_c0_seq2:236-832(-)
MVVLRDRGRVLDEVARGRRNKMFMRQLQLDCSTPEPDEFELPKVKKIVGSNTRKPAMQGRRMSDQTQPRRKSASSSTVPFSTTRHGLSLAALISRERDSAVTNSSTSNISASSSSKTERKDPTPSSVAHTSSKHEEDKQEQQPQQALLFAEMNPPKASTPAHNICSVCGFESKYVCVNCGAKYCSINCNKHHKDTRCV